MLTSKQRAFLRAMANNLAPAAQIGRQGVTPEAVRSLDEALEAREIVKVTVLNNCEEEPKAVAETLAGRTRAEVVQVIGNKVVVYRKSRTKQGIELP
ncbi:MAG: ribosome assembly RNA-binding protein YhbY [Defluviitaleaceae bacterium]|nr:ribosome assembly RNA-binding protein YhbY [Defluviitaleaceae bacterium]